MKIGKDTIATLEYTLRYDGPDGEVIEQYTDDDPTEVLVGRGVLLDILEKNLQDLEPGDGFDFLIDEEQGYGAYDEEKVVQFPEADLMAEVPEKERVEQIRQYLLRGAHPVFSFGEESGFPLIQAGQPVGLSDIPSYFCLPEKSVPGFHVSFHAAFARDILYDSSEAGTAGAGRARIGNRTRLNDAYSNFYRRAAVNRNTEGMSIAALPRLGAHMNV